MIKRFNKHRIVLVFFCLFSDYNVEIVIKVNSLLSYRMCFCIAPPSTYKTQSEQKTPVDENGFEV